VQDRDQIRAIQKKLKFNLPCDADSPFILNSENVLWFKR
jgi:hypothetical protein